MRRCPFLWGLRFFGLTPENREQLIYEPFFALNVHAGWSWEQFYNFPIVARRWFIKRLNEEFQKAQEEGRAPPSQAAAYNSPEHRALTGKSRSHVPVNQRGKLF